MEGRRNHLEPAPLKDDERDKVVDSFEELFERVKRVTTPRKENSITKIELEAQALALEANS